MRLPPALLALAGAAALAAGDAAAGGSVVVIRGTQVSVDAPPTPQRVGDGAWVEIVRPRAAPAPEREPEAEPEPAAPAPTVVVVVAPAPEPPLFATALAWGSAWPVWPAFPAHRPPPRRLAPPPFAGAFAPHRGPVRNFLHGSAPHPACAPRGG